MAIWADFCFGDGLTITTGPTKKIDVDRQIQWDFYTRQGVHLIQKRKTEDFTDVTRVAVEVDFKVKSGDLNFAFLPSWSTRN